MDVVTALIDLGLGLGAGFAGGLLGVGGGFIMTPVLILLLGMPAHVAVATSLFAVTMTSLSSTLYYAERGMVDYKLGMELESASMAGAILGAHAALLLPGYVIEIAFGLVLGYASLKMMASHGHGEEAARGEGYRHLWAGVAASFFAGILSGMLGIGGGTVKGPIMILIMGVPVHAAVPTSGFMIGLTAAAGSIVYLAAGYVDLVCAALLALGVFAGAQAGGRVAVKMKPLMLRRVFGAVLFLAAVRMVLKGMGV